MAESPIFLYLDNSNVFVNTQYYSSKINNYKDGIMDIQCRLNVGKLINSILDGRKASRRNAYGHMTKEVKHELEKVGFDVFLSDSLAGEKEVDTQLCVDAVEDILQYQSFLVHTFGNANGHHNGTLILISGDRDMRPLVKLARKHKWDVEVWSYKNTLSGSLVIEMERREYGSEMKIKLLDEVFSRFVFYDEKIPERQEDRTILVRFRDKGAFFKSLPTATKSSLISKITELAKAKFRLPLISKPMELNGENELAIGIVIVLDDRRLKKPLYNYDVDVVQKLPDLEQDLLTQLNFNFGNTALAITNLEPNVDQATVLRLFQRFGTVESCEVFKNNRLGKHGSRVDVAYVYFQDEGDATKAINTVHGSPALNKHKLDVRRHKSVMSANDVYVTKYYDYPSAPLLADPPARPYKNQHRRVEENRGRATLNWCGDRGDGNPSFRGNGGSGDVCSGFHANGGSGSSSHENGVSGDVPSWFHGNRGGRSVANVSAAPHLHPQYRTRFCVREVCDKSICVKAHSNEEIRCIHCHENHISNSCKHQSNGGRPH